MSFLQSIRCTPAAIDRLIEKVNARLRAQTPAAVAERGRLLGDLQRVGRQLNRLRQFILEGDTSGKVRSWLAEAEQEERRLQSDLAPVEGQARREPLQVHPGRAKQYLDELRETIEKGGLRARQLLKGDIERIIVHSVLDAPKPFARAEVISTGKGLLERVAFAVAGGGFEPTTFGL